MADDHIKIDTVTLAQLGGQLKTLHDNFDGATNIVDGFSGYMGSGDVAGAMHDFASDWDKKRKDILGSLDTLSQIATTAAQTYDGLDKHLAQVLEKAADSSGEK